MTTVKKPVEPKRVMRGTQTLHHDLVKLELSHMQKNLGTAISPRWVPTEHVHYYHSIDSKGRPQKHASPVGGHTHEVILKTDSKGNIVAEIGPAIVLYSNGKSEYLKHDNHTHESSYLGSDIVELKKASQDAIASLSQQMAKHSPQGVDTNKRVF